jgi:hypothetical protein
MGAGVGSDLDGAATMSSGCTGCTPSFTWSSGEKAPTDDARSTTAGADSSVGRRAASDTMVAGLRGGGGRRELGVVECAIGTRPEVVIVFL